MKAIKLISKSLFIAILIMMYSSVFAQDPVVVAPNIYKKVVLDNDRVRVLNVEIGAGETVPWHSHPDHVVYALTDGKIEITDKGKAPVTMDIKTGDAMYLPSVTHMAKNLGTNTIKLVVTEIKPMMKKMKSMTHTESKK